MPEQNDHESIKALLLENQRLLQENNDLLHIMRRSAIRHFWLNIIWILFFLGLPVLLYYYVLSPYLESFQALMPYQMSDFRDLWATPTR